MSARRCAFGQPKPPAPLNPAHCSKTRRREHRRATAHSRFFPASLVLRALMKQDSPAFGETDWLSEKVPNTRAVWEESEHPVSLITNGLRAGDTHPPRVLQVPRLSRTANILRQLGVKGVDRTLRSQARRVFPKQKQVPPRPCRSTAV